MNSFIIDANYRLQKDVGTRKMKNLRTKKKHIIKLKFECLLQLNILHRITIYIICRYVIVAGVLITT